MAVKKLSSKVIARPGSAVADGHGYDNYDWSRPGDGGNAWDATVGAAPNVVVDTVNDGINWYEEEVDPLIDDAVVTNTGDNPNTGNGGYGDSTSGDDTGPDQQHNQDQADIISEAGQASIENYDNQGELINPYSETYDDIEEVLEKGAELSDDTYGKVANPVMDWVDEHVTGPIKDEWKLGGEFLEEFTEFYGNPIEWARDAVYEDVPNNLTVLGKQALRLLFGRMPSGEGTVESNYSPDALFKKADQISNTASKNAQANRRTNLTGFGDPLGGAKTAPQPLGTKKSILSSGKGRNLLSGGTGSGKNTLG